jgi:hypothetical protein
VPRRETAKNAAGWEVCLADLESTLAGAETTRVNPDRWSDLHEHYAATFGVDPEVGRQAMKEYGQSA